MSSTNTMKWNAKVHEDVLIAVNVSQLPRADWDRIMVTLQGMGYTFTESALRQHLQKLKKKEGGTPSVPSTPTKPGGVTKQKNTPGSTSKKRAHQLAVQQVDEDEDEKMELKKPKLEMEAPNFGQAFGDEPAKPDDGDV
ncbi:hypothetical protein ONZ43_g5352 [Nemania bipapillata]|uniref:Uncharacterized protein n=1 Tax=Nemania bipapillata TaxID=110536 RepID=A0ACC2IBW5_9PEZI|nr:hypothetical protein ONZ43_g5352 [Nemania bipapillata]